MNDKLFRLAEEVENSPNMTHMEIANKIRDCALVKISHTDVEVLPIENIKEMTRRIEVLEDRITDAGLM